MTNEEKKLLLIDLCARLPYGVICHYDCVIPVGKRSLDKANAKDKLKGIIPMPGSHIGFMVGIDRVDALEGDIKPYLRPMSSMTEEERRTYDNLACDFNEISMSNSIDWLNENMFDFRSLIPMGLALEAEKGMYKTE